MRGGPSDPSYEPGQRLLFESIDTTNVWRARCVHAFRRPDGGYRVKARYLMKNKCHSGNWYVLTEDKARELAREKTAVADYRINFGEDWLRGEA